MRRIVRVSAVVVVLTLATRAGAAPTWQSPVRLASPADVYTGLAYDGPNVAVNARGDAAIGFSLFIGSTPVAEVVWRTAGAPDWSGPVRLAEGGWTSPELALDVDGNGLAVFDKGIVQTSYHPTGAVAWGDAITIGGNPFYIATPGFDAFGNAVTAWNVWRDPGVVVQAALRSPDGTWQQPPSDVSPTRERIWGPAALAVGRSGDALVAWSYTDNNDRSNVQTSFRRRGAPTWDAPVDVAADWGVPYAHPVFVGLDDAGGSTALWGYQREGVVLAYRPFGGGWQRAPTFSQAGRPEGLAVGPDGRALVLYTVGSRGTVFAISRDRAGDQWLPPVQLSDPVRNTGGVSLASDAQGNAVAMWIEHDNATNSQTLVAALRPVASGRWEPAVDVATSSGGAFSTASLELDGSGNAVAVWDPYAVQYRRAIDVIELKAGGPILSRLAVPTSSGTGVATPFSVSPLPWGAPLVASTTWDFGDGTSAAGNDVRHVYREVGMYAVTVSRSDASGATSTSSASIQVGRPTLANSERPSIRGAPHLGGTLVCMRGSWTGTEPIRYTYRWLQNGRVHARGIRYRIERGDLGARLTCRVAARNPAGTLAVASRPVKVRR